MTSRWVYWLSYTPDRDGIALTIADPTWPNPGVGNHDHCPADGTCSQAGRTTPLRGTTFNPAYVGPRLARLLTNDEVWLVGFNGKRAECEDPKPPPATLLTCSGGWAVGPDADPNLVVVRRPDGTVARYRRE